MEARTQSLTRGPDDIAGRLRDAAGEVADLEDTVSALKCSKTVWCERGVDSYSGRHALGRARDALVVVAAVADGHFGWLVL